MVPQPARQDVSLSLLRDNCRLVSVPDMRLRLVSEHIFRKVHYQHLQLFCARRKAYDDYQTQNYRYING